MSNLHQAQASDNPGIQANSSLANAQRSWYKCINKLDCFILLVVHCLFIFGALLGVRCQRKTFLFLVLYGYTQTFSITAGYHRLWSHRSYNASLPLRYLFAALGGSAAQRDIRWWCYRHRLHHRFTDTELDPYNARLGFWHSHIGWLLFRSPIKRGLVDIEDLERDPVVQWQRRNYTMLVVLFSIVIPIIIPHVYWGETVGGCVVYAVGLRLSGMYHGVFAINSVAHYFGDATYDDKNTSRDNAWAGLITLGEAFHNFHHQFPMDYRNGVKWYHWDPTKWVIWMLDKLGLASHLKVSPENEIQMSGFTMQLKALTKIQDKIAWPPRSCDLPVVDWESFQVQSRDRPLIVIAGFIHDVSEFFDEHPGGSQILNKMVGKDATAAFHGGVYDHSNAAHNLLAMKRVGVLRGGVEPGKLEEKTISPGQRWRITQHDL